MDRAGHGRATRDKEAEGHAHGLAPNPFPAHAFVQSKSLKTIRGESDDGKAKCPEKVGPAMRPEKACPVKSLGTATAAAAMADMTFAEIGRQLLRQDARAGAIRKRAGEVSMLGRFIGWFEWLVWANIHSYRVKVLLASTPVDLWAVFGAGLVQPKFAKEVLVAGVYQQGLATLAATDYPLRLNRWVIGDNKTRARLGQGAWAKSAHVQADKAGWRLRETAAQGDCGIDTMAYWENRPRVAESWLEIRQEIAGAMITLAKDPAWQDAFDTCQDGDHEQKTKTKNKKKQIKN